MDLAPTPTQQRLRDEVREWLAEAVDWDTAPGGGPPRFADPADEVAYLRGWQRRLATGRWVGVHWPVEYGGRGLGPLEAAVVTEELARVRAPELVGRIGVNLAGPTLLGHGSEEQRHRFLPHILNASQIWCQLFSEPDAGSDLAALTTRAEPDRAGRWLLTGQKVWTSYAQFADWGLCLARTDPTAAKTRGISMFIVDMHSPGITVRPLVQLTGDAEFNQVYLDRVPVPDDRRVGPVGGGWQVAGATLATERGLNPRQLVLHMQAADELLHLAVDRGADRDPRLAGRLAASYIDIKLFQLASLRAQSRLAAGGSLGAEGSVVKLQWSQASQRLHALAMDVLGPVSPLWRGGTGNPGDGRWQRSWLYYLASSIWAGTNEIQRNVIGERVLGLPREPQPGDR